MLQTFDLAEPFLARLTDFIEEKYLKPKRDLARLCIVFGGKRPALFLNRELARRTGQSFFPPVFFTIEQFVDTILMQHGRFTHFPDLDACYLVYHLTQKVAPQILKKRRSFAQFLPWAREILAFIEQLDLEDVSGESLKNIQLNARIGYAIPADINRLLEHIIRLREAYHKVMAENRTYSRGFKYWTASRWIFGTQFPDFDEIFFANFFYLHKTEEMIIKNLYERKTASLFFQGDEKDWPILRKAARNFNDRIEVSEEAGAASGNKSRQAAPAIQLYAGFDVHSQVGLLREILKKIPDLDKTVIVLPNPEHLVALLSEVTTLSEDFNVSMGYPLKRSSLYSLLDFIFRAQLSKKEAGYYVKDYLKVLRHPLVKNLKIMSEYPAVTRVLIHKIEEIIQGRVKTLIGGNLFLDLKEMSELDELYALTTDVLKKMGLPVSARDLKKIMERLHEVLFLSWEDQRNFYDFALALEKFLDFFVTRSFMGAYPLNLKITERMLGIVDELKVASFNREIFSQEDIFKIFQNRIDKELVAFAGSPLKGLQILGLFETRSLNFDQVIVMDVNEGILPKLQIYEPLIPREVMVSLNLDRLEQEEEIQYYQFRRLIAGAKAVHLIYSQTPELEKSRFIEAILWERQKKERNLEILKPERAGFSVKVIPKQTSIRKTPQVLSFLRNHRYSSTSLNTYLRCPLRFYYKYVLGLQEKEDLLEEPENRQVGTFVHELLEETFAGFVHKEPQIDAAFKDYFFRALDRKFEEHFGKSMKSDAFLLKAVLKVRLNAFLEQEEKRSGLRAVQELLYLEKRFEDRMPLSMGDISFVYQVDRVDRLEDGSVLVIDYKTGSEDPVPKNFYDLETAELTRDVIRKTVKSFQIPLYLYFLKRNFPSDPLKAAFYNLRTLELKAFPDPKITVDYGLLNESFKESLDFIMREILDPNVNFKPDDRDIRYCGTCPFYYVCR